MLELPLVWQLTRSHSNTGAVQMRVDNEQADSHYLAMNIHSTPSLHRRPHIWPAGWLIVWLAISAAAVSETGTLTVVQICDPQLGMTDYRVNVASFEQAVKQANLISPGFVVVCGDLVNSTNAVSIADFDRIKGAFTVPCYCVPGNHDVGNKPTLDSLARYRQAIGPDYCSVAYQGYRFILINTSLLKQDLDRETDKHLAWIKMELEDAAGKGETVYVCGHIPLFIKHPDEAEGYGNLPVQRRRELLSLFERYNVHAVLTGHAHGLITNRYAGIEFLSGEATSTNLDKRPVGFRLWTLSGTNSQSRFVPLGK